MAKKGKKQEESNGFPFMEAKGTEERVFANPKTGDEAEPDLPSLEHLANGYQTGESERMSKEDILERGTLIQKLRLFLGSYDLSGYFEAEEEITEEEQRKIKASILTQEDRSLTNTCVKEFNKISDFGKLLSFFFKRFQTSYAILAVLLNKWDSYEYTAKQLSTLYSVMKESFVLITEEDETVDLIDIYTKETISNIINDLIYSNILEGAKLKFNEDTEEFYIDVEEEGGLYSQILEEAKSTSKDLSDFKAYAIVAEDYIKKSKLKYMPIPIQHSIESAAEERYTRYLVKNLRYFRSDLNQRKARGETITQEDEKRAVIPDFYEVPPSKNVLKDCKQALKKM